MCRHGTSFSGRSGLHFPHIECATLFHIKGPGNVLRDFSTRNPLVCDESNYQIYKFIKETVTSAVHSDQGIF